MQAHSDQIFSMTEQFSSEGDGKIGGISALLFLHLACKDEHLSGGMLNFELHGKHCTSFKMVAASEVTKVLSMWFTTIFFRPELFLKRFKKI